MKKIYSRCSLAMIAMVFCLCGCQSVSRNNEETVIDVIAFASCAKANQPQEIWQSILDQDPDLFLFIGDNVYVDVPRPPKGVEDFEKTYAEFAAKQTGFQALREQVPVLATWDDHDYGLNDAGKEFPFKEIAQEQFIKFFDLPEDSPVRQRSGVYDAHLLGPEGKRVQIILLDTRYFRDPIRRNPKGRVNGRGPYIPRVVEQGSMLGETQWAWLEEQLRKPADLRIIASSIQVLNEESGWECWGNMPHEQDRLFNLIGQTKANGVVFISGDRHLTEVSRREHTYANYPIWDFTNSGMNEGNRRITEPNRHRVGESWRTSNFGVFQVEWDKEQPRVVYRSLGREGQVILQQAVPLSQLKGSE